MTRRSLLIHLTALLIALLPLASLRQVADAYPRPRPGADDPPPSPRSPLLFVENVGQFEAPARFQVLGGAGLAWLAEDGVWLTLLQEENVRSEDFSRPVDMGAPEAATTDSLRRGVHLKLSFPGANAHPRREPFGRAAPRISYLAGHDPARWHPDAPVWTGVRYVDLYPGVDLEIAGAGQAWAWQLICRDDCQAGLSAVRLRVEGADALAGIASTAPLGGDRLRVSTAIGELTLPLLALRDAAGQPFSPTAAPAIAGAEVAAPFTARLPVEEPATAAGVSDLLYATYLGGIESEVGYGVAAVTDGSAYVTGQVAFFGFPTTPGAFQDFNGRWDAFVAKLSPTGDALVYATYLGGAGDDIGRDIAVDAGGHAYVAGYTASPDFPVTPGAFATAFQGSVTFPGDEAYDGFVAKLNPAGTGLVYATYLAGDEKDMVRGIAVDADGAAYVAGTTYSNNFPVTPAAFDRICGTESAPCTTRQGDLTMLIPDGFVAKLDPTGATLVYSTFLGGREPDGAYAVAVDERGRAAVTGSTRSPDFPLAGATVDLTVDNDGDAFATKLWLDGSRLVLSTFLGGDRSDAGYAVAVGAGLRGDVYVTGATDSADFPTWYGYDVTWNGHSDGFVARLNGDQGWLTASTYLGGSGVEKGYGVGLDGAGDVYVTGYVHYGAGFPISPGAYSSILHGADAFIVRMDPLLSTVKYGTYLGGVGANVAYDLAVEQGGAVTVTGYGETDDFPATPGAFDTTFNGGADVTVARLLLRAYTVTGQARDWAGNPLANITLEVGAGVKATTDVSGTYRFANLGSGTYTITATTRGYFWQPASRTVSVPPNLSGQDFVGRNVVKESAVPSWRALAYGEPITYTLRLHFSTAARRSLTDALPPHTAFVAGSLSAPAGIVYDAVSRAITGTLDERVGVGAPAAVVFSVQTTVTGMITTSHVLVNRACVRPQSSGLEACQWSDEVRNYTYLWPVYLPLMIR